MSQGESERDRYPDAVARRRGARYRADRRLIERGADSLSSSELLGLVLGREELAERLIRSHGLRRLAHLPARALESERGLGRARLVRWCAVRELGRRLYEERALPRRAPIRSPADAYAQLHDLGAKRKEHLVGLYLDVQHGLLCRETISVGSLNSTRAHPREILQPAIEHLAAGFILAHNHPSGTLEPSPEDWAFTRAIGRAAEIVGIELLDHLIVTGEGYCSLRAEEAWDESSG